MSEKKGKIMATREETSGADPMSPINATYIEHTMNMILQW